MARTLRLDAGAEAGAGERLDRFLATRPEVGSRAAAQRLIAAGAVTVDGAPRQKRHVLAAGEVVEVALPERGAPAGRPEASAFGVAYEDAHLLVVDKPAGMVVHPARGHREGTLAQALAGVAAGGAEPARAGIVQRLDKDTSGLMVVAKDEATHRGLGEQMRARAVEREYLALVEGRPASRTGTIDAPLGRDVRDRTRMSVRTDRPRQARTHFRIERALPRTTLLRVRLETGRTHQVRAHLAAIGHPICGDPRYGAEAGRLGLERQFLHSARLAFTHPVTGERVECRSELPADLQAALAAAAVE